MAIHCYVHFSLILNNALQCILLRYREFEEFKMMHLPAFGRVVVLDRPGDISVGDPVYAIRDIKS